jgi:hypothetical protein
LVTWFNSAWYFQQLTKELLPVAVTTTAGVDEHFALPGFHVVEV